MKDDKYKNNPQQFNQYKAKWLDIGVFRNLSAAECTEHACITQNLLSFCDIDACYVSGHINSKNLNEDHAYNIFLLDGEYYLLDTTNPICLFNE